MTRRLSSLELIARRRLRDRAFVASLDRQIAKGGWAAGDGTPADWAMESYAIAREAMTSSGALIDEAYYRAHIAIVEHRLALGGLRLAAVLNHILH